MLLLDLDQGDNHRVKHVRIDLQFGEFVLIPLLFDLYCSILDWSIFVKIFVSLGSTIFITIFDGLSV